jgi:hypothetical protein
VDDFLCKDPQTRALARASLTGIPADEPFRFWLTPVLPVMTGSMTSRGNRDQSKSVYVQEEQGNLPAISQNQTDGI